MERPFYALRPVPSQDFQQGDKVRNDTQWYNPFEGVGTKKGGVSKYLAHGETRLSIFCLKTSETIKAVGPFLLNMVVVKLENGDIMLYSPVRVR